jgi:putative ABC transport system substrate-binding protein
MLDKHNLQRKSQKALIVLTWFVVVTLLLSGCGSPAQQPKQYRVGILAGVPSVAQVVEGFRTGMTELGYIEGENIFYDVQIVNFDIATYQSILKKFVDDDVDLILVFPTEAALEAKTIAQDANIPFVFNFI